MCVLKKSKKFNPCLHELLKVISKLIVDFVYSKGDDAPVSRLPSQASRNIRNLIPNIDRLHLCTEMEDKLNPVKSPFVESRKPL